MLLFVRYQKTNEMGTEPYMFRGPATSATPVIGRSRSPGGFEQPMPLAMFTAARVAAG